MLVHTVHSALCYGYLCDLNLTLCGLLSVEGSEIGLGVQISPNLCPLHCCGLKPAFETCALKNCEE